VNQLPIHPAKKLKLLQFNESQYVAKLTDKIKLFTNQNEHKGCVTFQEEKPKIIVKECIDALDKFCKGVNTPKNYEIASHLMCWIVRHSPIIITNRIAVKDRYSDNHSINGFFAIHIAFEILGLDMEKILNVDKAFLIDTIEIIQPKTQKMIEQQIYGQNITLEHLCKKYNVYDQCLF
jgi:hypothetical protein